MRNWTGIISPNKGETLVECLVSLLIFSVLMLSVTTMVQISLRITLKSTQAAEALQSYINHVVLSVSDAAPAGDDSFVTESTVTFTFSTDDGDISVTHEIYLFSFPADSGDIPEEDGISLLRNLIAFDPKP